MPLAILRPVTGILTGEHGIGRQFADFFAARNSGARRVLTAAQIYQELRKPDESARAFLTGLINAATETGHAAQRLANPDAPPPTPLIAVDQAEELFAAGDLEESARFLRLFADLTEPHRTGPDAPQLTIAPQLIWTLRADSMDALLQATEAARLKPPALFPLPPVPRDAYRDIIETPLEVANAVGMKLVIDPLLVDALVAKSAGADALPLLAFTLRQLISDNRVGSAAKLTLESFEAAGGMEGVLAARLAVAQRVGGCGPEALRQLFLPHLCTWDAEATPPGAKRLVAREADLTQGPRADHRILIVALVDERLLTRSGDASGAVTLEMAHEALLRQPPISEWLEADREFLIWRDRTAKARAAYEVNARGLLMGRELEIARGWLEVKAAVDVPAADRAFVEESVAVDASRRREAEAKEQQYREAELRVAKARVDAAHRVAQRTMAGLVAAVLLALAASTAGFWAWHQKRATEELRRQTQITESGLLSIAADAAYGDGNNWTETTNAALLALEGLPDISAGVARPPVAEAQWQLERANRGLRELVRFAHDDAVGAASFSPDGTRIVTASGKTMRVWDAATGKELVCTTYNGSVWSASFSPDGARIVGILNDPTARVWDAATGKELAKLAHGFVIRSASFSPGGARIVTASLDHTARVWDAATGKELVLFAHDDGVKSASFNPDRTRIVTVSGKTAQVWDAMWDAVWDAATGKELAKFIYRELSQLVHDGSVEAASFSPDGARIVTASDDHTARLWDAATGKELARFAHDGSVKAASFSPDGARIVTVSDIESGNLSINKTEARVWDAATDKELARFALDGSVTAASFSPDGTRIVTASGKTARVWDAATGKELARLAHDDSVSGASFSPDGTRIVTASGETARVWDAATDKELARFALDRSETASSVSPDGARIVTASGKTARVWDAATGKELARLVHDDIVNAAALSPDGTRIVTASGETARVWDAATGKELARFALDGSVTAASFSPDGARIVGMLNDSTARVWDAATGKELAQLAHDGSVTGASFSPDGARIVTASGKTARAWDAATGKELARFAHDDGVKSASFNPDRTRIVTVSDKTARVWDAATGKELARLVHDDIVNAAAFSPDGARLVTTSKTCWIRIGHGREKPTCPAGDRLAVPAFSPDGAHIVTVSNECTAPVWDAATGKELVCLSHNRSVLAATFSPDGTHIATISGTPSLLFAEDLDARVWDAATGKELARLALDRSIFGAAFSPRDGAGYFRIMTTSGNIIYSWRVERSVDQLVQIAKRRVPRCLSSHAARPILSARRPATLVHYRLGPRGGKGPR